MYAATQAGHLGSSASTAPGTTQPAISPPRRATLPQLHLTYAPPATHRSVKMRVDGSPVKRLDGWCSWILSCMRLERIPHSLAARGGNCAPPSIVVLVVAAEPETLLVAPLGCAIEPLVHAPEGIQSARIG